MKVKQIGIWALYTFAVVGGSIAITHATVKEPPKPKEIVTVDVKKLVRLKAEAISQKETGDMPSHEAQMELAAYTEKLNERMGQIAESANVVILVNQAVLAGAHRDITDLLMEQ